MNGCRTCSSSSGSIGTALVLLLTLIALFAWAAQPPSGAPKTSNSGSLKTSSAGPPIMVSDLSGHSVDLSGVIADKPTLLIFWATWCSACRAEIPAFKETYARYSSKGLNVIGVNVGYSETREGVKAFAEKNSLPYAVLFDGAQQATRTYGVEATPSVLLLNRAGRVVSIGYSINDEAIQKLLGGGA